LTRWKEGLVLTMSKKDEFIDCGVTYCACHPDAGGAPRCKLGRATTMSNGKPWMVDTIQVKGACASDCLAKVRNPIDREYDIMVIGEAPRMIEDQKGIPFIDASGEMLLNFLVDAEMDLDRVYCTNMAKCRPPKNRTPSVEELNMCLTHVYHEIREIQPKVIVIMGNTGLRLFNINKEGGITKTRGKLYDLPLPHWEDGPSFKVIPTFHPSYFLYRDDPKIKARVKNDFIFAKRIAEGEEIDKNTLVYQTTYEVVETELQARAMVDEIKEHGVFSFDTESPDLYFMDSPMRLLQLSIGIGKNWLVPFYKHNPESLGFWQMDAAFDSKTKGNITRILSEVFESEDIAKAAHNIKYDMNVVKRWLGLETKGMLWDTAIMHHLLYEYGPHKLEYLADVEFATGDYSCLIREIVGHGRKLIKTYDCIPDELLFPYGAIDAESTYRLMRIYYDQLVAKPNLMKLYMEESYETILSLQEFEWVGNKIIVESVEDLQESLQKEVEDLTVKCRKYTKPEFNPGSPDEVKSALIALGFNDQVSVPEKSRGFSTAKDILAEIDHPLAGHVATYRNRKKLLGTYVENVQSDLNMDGRVRYGFNPSGPTNGRLSCTLLHQIPRIDHEAVDKGAAVLRSIFGEEEDYFYVYGDFSQIELRIFSYLTGERELIEFLEGGKDIHRLSAAAALNIPFNDVTDTNRSNIGKPINFGAIYGSKGYSIGKLEFENPITGKKELIGYRAKEFVENFRRRYTKVDDYLLSVPEYALARGGILTSVFGRERRMMGLNDPDPYKRGHAEREAANFTVSSPAAAITLRTINLVRRALKEAGVGLDMVRPVNTVHDSMAYGVHKSMIDWFPPVLKSIAERNIPELSDKVFPLKYGIGKTWTEAELNAA